TAGPTSTRSPGTGRSFRRRASPSPRILMRPCGPSRPRSAGRLRRTTQAGWQSSWWLMPATWVRRRVSHHSMRSEQETSSDRGRCDLSKRLAARQRLDAAAATAQAIRDVRDRAKALVAVARAHAQAGHQAASRAAFTDALLATKAIELELDYSGQFYTGWWK